MRNDAAKIEAAERLVFGEKCTAVGARSRAPSGPGYYKIFIDDGRALPSPYRDLLLHAATNLIYVGIARKSLHERLVEQDLQHQTPSTFFRGIGAILGYRPKRGSLIGKANQNNYKFSGPDTTEIIKWIDGHLSVSWAEANPPLKTTEESLIREYRPILNTLHNPDCVPQLAALRDECRRLAMSA